MPKFSSAHQPATRTPRGPSRAKQQLRMGGERLLKELLELALAGDLEAAKLVMPYICIKLRSATPENTLDYTYLEVKIKEITELENRLQELEARAKKFG